METDLVFLPAFLPFSQHHHTIRLRSQHVVCLTPTERERERERERGGERESKRERHSKRGGEREREIERKRDRKRGRNKRGRGEVKYLTHSSSPAGSYRGSEQRNAHTPEGTTCPRDMQIF